MTRRHMRLIPALLVVFGSCLLLADAVHRGGRKTGRKSLQKPAVDPDVEGPCMLCPAIMPVIVTVSRED